MSASAPDAVVVGSGPNGLAAAIELARAGRSVVVYEAATEIGGGTRTDELTEPGFLHDVCSTVHPLLLASPFFQSLPLDELGVELAHPEVQFAHPLDDGTAVEVHRSVERTAAAFGRDSRAYIRLMRPLVDRVGDLMEATLGPFQLPKHPLLMARFGLNAIRSAEGLAKRFHTTQPRSLIAGAAAHSMLPLDRSPTAGVAMVLVLLAHAMGWPVVRGGSGRIAEGMASYLTSLGGQIVTDTPIAALEELPEARAVLFDLTPKQIVEIAGRRLPARYVKALRRYRYGAGVFKIDWALNEPVPWRAEACRRAGTVHIGGTLEEITAAEATMGRGEHAPAPYVLLAQQSVADPSRAPEGKQTLWAYCHVPSGSTKDMTLEIESQIERFAPGFRDVIAARATSNAQEIEAYNANYVGGDINGGMQDLWQHFTRPVARWSPYTTPDDGIYICSSATPPGGGVHGMCGYHAARAALKKALR